MRRPALLWATAAIAAAAAVALPLVLLQPGSGHPSQPASPARGALRTVLVADPGKPLPRSSAVSARDCLGRPSSCVNGAGGVVLAYAVAASPPRRATQALVLTDESCEPDRFDVSHCLNRLRLPDGRTLTVRHDHRMSEFPCLSPGERVRVVAL